MSSLPCPSCGAEMVFLREYQRHYCRACAEYAPPGYGAQGQKRCPKCAGILCYVLEHDRFYCHRCGTYAEPVAADVAPSQTPVVPTRGEPKTPPEAPRVVSPPPLLPSSQDVASPVPAPKPPAAKTIPEPKPTPPGPQESAPSAGGGAEPVRPPTKMGLRRSEVLRAGKSELMDLCEACGLTPFGTREQLRVRLLSYLEELEAEGRPPEREPPPPRGLTGPLKPIPVEPPRNEERIKVSMEPSRAASTPSTILLEERMSEPFVIKVEVTPGAPPFPRVTSVVEPRREPEAAPRGPAPVAPRPVPRRALLPRPSDHPCPTCGRELDYIARYNRWFCYSCRRYAPTAAFKHACPSCGATLRWIERYRRWWCDTCRTYAPRDLPMPESLAQMASANRATSKEETPPVESIAAARPRRNWSTGVSLVGFGLALWVVYVALAEAPAAFAQPVLLTPDVAFVLRFAGLLIIAVGGIIALLALRNRQTG